MIELTEDMYGRLMLAMAREEGHQAKFPKGAAPDSGKGARSYQMAVRLRRMAAEGMKRDDAARLCGISPGRASQIASEAGFKWMGRRSRD